MPNQLSLADARAMALAAQGFDRPRPARPTIRDLARVIRQLALVQLDYVNVVVPSHYQVPFSRLGAHGIATVADLADYFRMPVRDARPRVEELAEEGAVRPVRVEGWREPAFFH